MKLEDAAIPREQLKAIEATLSAEQRAHLEAGRERARNRLAQLDMQPEAIRARTEAAAKWEEEHGEISAFCGKQK